MPGLKPPKHDALASPLPPALDLQGPFPMDWTPPPCKILDPPVIATSSYAGISRQKTKDSRRVIHKFRLAVFF